MKQVAAYRAADMVASGMVVGLGTGSTAAHFIDRLAHLMHNGSLTGIIGIPTSMKTEKHATKAGIPLSTLDSHPIVDISIDGADEVDLKFNLVKGRGGSLFREKMIEGASCKFVVIVDETKMVSCLGGSGLAVPVEIVPFSWKYTLSKIQKLFENEIGFSARLRVDQGKPFETDNKNYIIEMFFEKGVSGDLNEVSDNLLRLNGVIEHGMFLDMATNIVLAKKDGSVVILNK
jgi:ribose 5-phosphate isomerase A